MFIKNTQNWKTSLVAEIAGGTPIELLCEVFETTQAEIAAEGEQDPEFGRNLAAAMRQAIHHGLQTEFGLTREEAIAWLDREIERDGMTEIVIRVDAGLEK